METQTQRETVSVVPIIQEERAVEGGGADERGRSGSEEKEGKGDKTEETHKQEREEESPTSRKEGSDGAVKGQTEGTGAGEEINEDNANQETNANFAELISAEG